MRGVELYCMLQHYAHLGVVMHHAPHRLDARATLVLAANRAAQGGCAYRVQTKM